MSKYDQMKKEVQGGAVARPPTPDLSEKIEPQQQQAAQAAVKQLLAMGLDEQEIVEMILEMLGEAGHEVDEIKVKKMVSQGV